LTVRLTSRTEMLFIMSVIVIRWFCVERPSLNG